MELILFGILVVLTILVAQVHVQGSRIVEALQTSAADAYRKLEQDDAEARSGGRDEH